MLILLFYGEGGGKGKLPPTSLRVKPIFKPKIYQADHFRPKTCFHFALLLNKSQGFSKNGNTLIPGTKGAFNYYVIQSRPS